MKALPPKLPLLSGSTSTDEPDAEFSTIWSLSSVCRALIVIVLLSFVPGRMHRWIAQAFRWPLLGIVYAAIGVELV